MPFVSDALAVKVILEPALKLLAFDGLVILTTGKYDEEAVMTLTVIGFDIVDTPLVSVALAVMVKVPVVAFNQLAEYGELVAVAKRYDPE